MGGKYVRSVNWHITSRCNYNCRFCFARRLGEEIRDITIAVNILEKLKDIGMKKINFVGGEPLLHPLIFDLIRIAKEMGFLTSIVSNGYYLNRESIERLSPWLDLIGLSVDSSYEKIQSQLGRGDGTHINHIYNVASLVHDNNINLKINTTVTKLTFTEDMKPLIKELNPMRWKVFQVLPVMGQNEEHIEELKISNCEFKQFIQRNCNLRLAQGEMPVFETNDNMVDSYFMIGPDGSIVKNSGMDHSIQPMYCSCIEQVLEIVDWERYYERGGDYWNH